MNTGGPIITMDNALKALINETLLIPANTQDQVQISFSEPTKEFVSQLSRLTINLHLFRIHENLERRQSETFPNRAPQNNQNQEGRRPRIVDLSYMVTVWNASDQLDTEAEHRILGQMIQVLGKYQMLPESILDLVGFDAQGFGVAFNLMENNGSQRSDGEYWSALGAHPKPTLNMRLSVPVDVFDAQFVPVVLVAGTTLHNDTQSESGPTYVVSLYGNLDTSNLLVEDESFEVWVRAQNGTILVAQIDQFYNYRFLNLESETYQIAVYDASGTRRSDVQQQFIPLDENGHARLATAVDFIINPG